MTMFELQVIQQMLAGEGLDGWLLYDFRGSNVLARRIAGLDPQQIATRRWFYFVPARGTPVKLVHRIESGALEHLPGETRIYLRWQELEAQLAQILANSQKIAMEYSPHNANPYISRVDAGTIELVRSYGMDIVSSGDLVQRFEATWNDDQWRMHLEAAQFTDKAFERAWQYIAAQVRSHGAVHETEVQQTILDHFAEHSLVTDHPPIVAVGPHSGDPHYAPTRGHDAAIRAGDFVLVDLWAKMDRPQAVYSDLTRVAFVADSVPDNFARIFRVVANARDAAIALVREAFAGGRLLRGWEVDQAARSVIESAGYGEYFVHRTGHSIGQETHGNGANMDNLETHEERLVMRRTCFSIEPGIYLDKFGVRSEVNVFIDANGGVHVTGGALQTEILPILAFH